MKKISNFDVLYTMSTQNKDIRGFPLSNITQIHSGKKQSTVTIAVNNQTAQELMITRKLGGMFILYDINQFNQLKKEMEAGDDQQHNFIGNMIAVKMHCGNCCFNTDQPKCKYGINRWGNPIDAGCCNVWQPKEIDTGGE